MQKDPMEAATDLIRRLPPQHLEQNVELVCQLAPDIADDVLATVDQPLKVLLCSKTGKPFLICDYNRDGDAYRFLSLFKNTERMVDLLGPTNISPPCWMEMFLHLVFANWRLLQMKPFKLFLICTTTVPQ